MRRPNDFWSFRRLIEKSTPRIFDRKTSCGAAPQQNTSAEWLRWKTWGGHCGTPIFECIPPENPNFEGSLAISPLPSLLLPSCCYCFYHQEARAARYLACVSDYQPVGSPAVSVTLRKLQPIDTYLLAMIEYYPLLLTTRSYLMAVTIATYNY